MANNSFDNYQKLLNEIEKQKNKSKVLSDHLKSTQYRNSQNIDYKKNNSLRKERTHRLVQKGALFEKYIEDHLKGEIPNILSPEEAEILLEIFSEILTKNKPYVINKWNKKKSKQK